MTETSRGEQPDQIELSSYGEAFAWDGDGSLVVTDPQFSVLSRVRKKALSPSTANSLANGCHARWAIESVLPRSSDPFGAAEKGTAGHAVLEELLRLPGPDRTRETAGDLLANIERLHPEIAYPRDPFDLVRWRGEVAAVISQTFDLLDLPALDVLGLEQYLTGVLIDGAPLHGYFDATVRGLGGGTRILDWKTGKHKVYRSKTIPNEKADQMRLYALGLNVRDGVMPEAADLVFTSAGVIEPVDLSAKALDATRAMFVSSWGTLNEINETGRYAAAKSPLCPWCPLATVCPTGNADKPVVAKSSACEVGPLLHIETLARRTTQASAPNTASTNTASTNTAADDVAAPSKEISMVYAEGKSWDETLPAGHTSIGDAALNQNSFAAMAAYGLSAMALEFIDGQDKIRPTGGTITALALTLAKTVDDAHVELVGSTGMQNGLHTRLRGLLRSVVEMQPLPFGQDEAAWRLWHDKAVSRIVMLARIATTVWATSADKFEANPTPWAALAADEAQVPAAA